MKPPIPNLVAHANEPKSNKAIYLVFGLIILAVIGLIIYVNKKYNDKKAN